MHRTGAQFRLTCGPQTVVVVELGGALRHYAVAERPIVDGFDADDPIEGGRGQLLMPWPNRIGDGRYRWRGRELQLPLNEVEHANAIHGLLRWTSWQPVEQTDGRVVLTTTLWPQPGYPFHLVARAEYALDRQGLTVTLTARNVGDAPAPYGVGQHPYLAVGPGTVDDTLLTVPARTWLRTDDRGLPVATEAVSQTSNDFGAPRPIGPQQLDTAFTDLRRSADGRAVVRLSEPSGAYGTDLWLGQGADFVQVYTGDTLAEPHRRRSVAVEPMSCGPDAFRRDPAQVRLEPGARHTLRWGLVPWRG
ncbi:aldose 1-epimerase family protein [Streptomyces sp. NBC_00539]|uniref:aldose 1-epimerase family protein n=1 Tax=Streptomyces sp. NBC_00539 TaxID=2975770 RepID=UPI002E80974B|nr:aldose 1-epimerase family protein [Streptomyces sp. NBC_00539]WUC62882.1 aldose 1-epimerase family protein [Streptomyces sp. NBC_00539]